MKSVVVCEERLVLPTYPEPALEPYPMFAESRVHQRSSGNPYPNRVAVDVDRTGVAEKAYRAIRLENAYLRVVLLPELGGRIYSAYDKVNGYDFFYKQHVIKPALIGLLGSWVSGGVEFNWPCHHRPSTFMPCDASIEREPDGAVTVWMSEHEPLDRMKGMHGIRLSPDSSLLETRMRVYNRTELRRSFLWWENAAVPVNEQYRLFFPPDVRYVQFHYRKNVTTYPVAQGQYNGIGMGDGTDISYHRNTRQPTSYFSAPSAYDFFGGYDEGRGAGVVHVASRHTAPGKKMFTWAYNQLSRSWERALTDTDGAYAELMAGSYTNNQPDFAWLEPFETKTFTQSWYPIGAMGAPECANEHAALRIGEDAVWIQSVRPVSGACVCIDGREHTVSLEPGVPVRLSAPGAVAVQLADAEGRVLLRYARKEIRPLEMPEPLPPVPALDSLHSPQGCYLAGAHAQQYRDPAAQPEAYWQAALQKDALHIPSLVALASLRYARGQYGEALSLARRAWGTVTQWNDHPESGRLPMLLGLIYQALGNDDAAYDWFYRASWNRDALLEAMLMLAGIDARRGDIPSMATHAARALEIDCRCGRARALYALSMMRQGDPARAKRLLAEGLAADPLDHLLRWLQCACEGTDAPGFYAGLASDPAQTCLDIAWDLHDCGEDALAARLLQGLPSPTAMTAYTLAYMGGEVTDALMGYGIAFPGRRQEEAVLEQWLSHRPDDVQALWGLGCLLYGQRRYREAAARFEAALEKDARCVQALRGLAIACYSHLGRREEALPLLLAAADILPEDQQLLYEAAYLMTRLGRDPLEKSNYIRARLPRNPRGDLLVELAHAENLAGRHREALAVLEAHTFTPCEGGEHAVAEQYMFAHYALGRAALETDDAQGALAHFEQAQTLPENLGAGIWNEVIKTPHRYFQAVCLERLGRADEAAGLWAALAGQRQDYFSDMYLPELPCWQAMCHARLGHPEKGRQLAAHHYDAYEKAREREDAGYFRTTPFFISYMEDAATLRRAACDWQQAMALLAVGDAERAAPLLARARATEPGHLYMAWAARR